MYNPGDDDEQEDEGDLVDDGFFENLMNKGKKPEDNVESESEKVEQTFDPDASRSQQNGNADFSEFLNKKDQEWSPIKDQPIHLNDLIYQNIKVSYFPKNQMHFEIFQEMLRKESEIERERDGPFENVFKVQENLTEEMRLILLDWICQVSSDYGLKRQTFHLTLQYIDAFLQKCPEQIQTYEFQLVGITCLHMAAKIEEIYPPHI